jgi:hypothetical protein
LRGYRFVGLDVHRRALDAVDVDPASHGGERRALSRER